MTLLRRMSVGPALGLALFCAGAEAAPPLAGPDATADLGQVAVGEMRSFELRMTNATGQCLEITNVESSCECLQVLAYPFRLPVGTTNALLMRLVPDREGNPSYRVTVGFAGDSAPPAAYEVRARVTPAAGPAPVGSAGIAPDLLCTVIRTPDPRWYTPVEDVLQSGKVRDGATVVDVRSAGRFEASHIPGALNIPLYLVKTKPFLRAGEVVLVDDGWGSECMEQECARLGGTGFRSVRILLGGMSAWSRNGRPLAGARVVPASTARISPADFMASRGNSEWLIVNTEPGERDFGYLLPRHVTIPFAPDTKVFDARLNELVLQQPACRRLLIVDSRGALYDAMAPALQAVRGAEVFCLEGGLDAFREHLVQLTQMRERTTATSQTRTGGRRISKSCDCP